MFADRLKKSLLQAAIQGQLTEQLPTDGNARDLLRKIRAEKAKLIAAKKIKAEKPLPTVTDDEIPFDIPESWCWVRLGDVCQINPRNKVEDENIDATFLSMTAINDGYSNGYNPLVKSWNEIRSGFTHFADGDVIFAKITPCFQNRKSAIVKGLTNGIGAGTTELYVLRSYGKYINEKYLLYFVKNQQFILDGIATMKGTAGQQRISRNFVVNYFLPLPPFAEQKRIVEKLDELLSEVDELAKDERELVKLEETFPRRMRNSLLQAAIQGKLTEQLSSDGDARDLLRKIRTEKAKLIAAKKMKAEKLLPSISDDEIPFDLPDNWCWCRLGELCEHLQRGKSPKYSQIKKYPVVAQKCNQSWGFKMEQAKFIDPDTLASYDKERFLQADDLLWNSTGLGTVGRAALYDPLKNLYELAVADSHVTVIRLLKNFVLPKFVFYYITSPVVQFKIDLMVSGSTKQKELATETVRKLIVPLPPLDEQNRITERLERLLPLCNNRLEHIDEI